MILKTTTKQRLYINHNVGKLWYRVQAWCELRVCSLELTCCSQHGLEQREQAFLELDLQDITVGRDPSDHLNPQVPDVNGHD